MYKGRQEVIRYEMAILGELHNAPKAVSELSNILKVNPNKMRYRVTKMLKRGALRRVEIRKGNLIEFVYLINLRKNEKKAKQRGNK